MEKDPHNVKCNMGILSRADGSAIYSCDDTVVEAAVYGPVEIKQNKLMIEKAHIEVTYKPSSGMPGIADRLKEATINKIFQAAILCSLHPRTLISINIQEMQDCGGALACAINASCLAIINAGLPTAFLVAAVSCMIDSNGEFLVDFNKLQFLDSRASFTFVYDSINKDIISTETSGIFTPEELIIASSTCRDASKKYFNLYRDMASKFLRSTLLYDELADS